MSTAKATIREVTQWPKGTQPPDKSKVLLALEIPAAPRSSPKEEKWMKQKGEPRPRWDGGSHKTTSLCSGTTCLKLLHQKHELTHMGKTALEILLGLYYLVAHLPTLCSSVSQRCVTCLQNNTRQGSSRSAGTQHCGFIPL